MVEIIPKKKPPVAVKIDVCPKGCMVLMQERSDIDSRKGWVSCSSCGYMIKIVDKDQ